MNGDEFVEDELIEKWMEQERMIRYLLEQIKDLNDRLEELENSRKR